MRDEAEVRAEIADRIRAKITEWEPHCPDRYIRGMRAALLFVTGEADEPLFASSPSVLLHDKEHSE